MSESTTELRRVRENTCRALRTAAVLMGFRNVVTNSAPVDSEGFDITVSVWRPGGSITTTAYLDYSTVRGRTSDTIDTLYLLALVLNNSTVDLPASIQAALLKCTWAWRSAESARSNLSAATRRWTGHDALPSVEAPEPEPVSDGVVGAKLLPKAVATFLDSIIWSVTAPQEEIDLVSLHVRAFALHARSNIAPGEHILDCLCPCCGATLEIGHGDEDGTVSVLGAVGPGTDTPADYGIGQVQRSVAREMLKCTDPEDPNLERLSDLHTECSQTRGNLALALATLQDRWFYLERQMREEKREKADVAP